ncbi:hypothetical protein [Bradyrhizobium sp. USDA 3650]
MAAFLGSTMNWLKAAGVVGVAGALFVLGGRAGWYGSSKISAVPLSSSETPVGVIYFLPKTSIVLDLTWKITRCDVVQRGPSPKDPQDVIIESEIAVTEFAAKVEPDPTQGYTIKSDTMDGAFWRTDLDIALSNGMLASFNAMSSGQIPNQEKFEKFLTNVASTPLTNKTSAGEGADAAGQRKAICGTRLIQATEAKDANSKAPGLSVRKTFRFDPGDCPAGFKELPDKTCILSGEVLLSPLLLEGGAASDALNQNSIEIRTTRFRTTAGKQPQSGVVYRIPGSANVEVCSPKCDQAGRTIAANTFVVPQFGAIGAISVERRMFSDRTAQLKFGSWGELTEAKFADAASASADKSGK